MASTNTDTERTIYCAVLVVEHEPGVGQPLDHEHRSGLGVRANLVTWLDGLLVRGGTITPENFYEVRDVTLYSAADLMAELAEHGEIAKFPDVATEAEV